MKWWAGTSVSIRAVTFYPLCLLTGGSGCPSTTQLFSFAVLIFLFKHSSSWWRSIIGSLQQLLWNSEVVLFGTYKNNLVTSCCLIILYQLSLITLIYLFIHTYLTNIFHFSRRLTIFCQMLGELWNVSVSENKSVSFKFFFVSFRSGQYISFISITAFWCHLR
jgi:hypothetical protein